MCYINILSLRVTLRFSVLLVIAVRQLTAHLVTLTATKRNVILNAKRERIRIPLERERIATAVTRLRNDNSFILNVCHTNGKVKFIM